MPMMDQEAAEKITKRVQTAFAQGDEQAVKWISETDEFKRMCRMLRIRPAAALANIKESMGPDGGDANGME